jgi:TetR/AcrR family transcriptional regulator
MPRRAPRKRPTSEVTSATVRTHVPWDERRQQILNAAAELFSQYGFAGTTTRRIAGAVGTSETVLFRHFPTKENLYAATLEHEVPAADVERWLDELRRLADKRDDEALFTAVVEAILRSYRANPAYHRLMLFAALENHELARLGRVKYVTPVTNFLRSYVAKRQAEGAFRKYRPELVAHMLVSVAGHHATWNLLGVNPFSLSDREVATQAVSLLTGLRSKS